MDFSFKDDFVQILSDKKNIVLQDNAVVLDELRIDMAWEYEKSGFLMYVRESLGILYFYFRVEGNWVGYISAIPTEIDAKIAEFFGQLDILVAPFSKEQQKFLEQLEPKMIISYAPNAGDLVQILWQEAYRWNNYKAKIQDISSEKTSLVILEK